MTLQNISLPADSVTRKTRLQKKCLSIRWIYCLIPKFFYPVEPAADLQIFAFPTYIPQRGGIETEIFIKFMAIFT
jgi:hypothetical protein